MNPPEPPTGSAQTDVVQYAPEHRGGRRRRDAVILERPLNVDVDGTGYTLLRTPGADRELVAGFLFTEGLIATLSDVRMMRVCPASPDAVTVRTVNAQSKPHRSLLVTSSCGLCGREDLEALVAALGRVENTFRVPLATMYRLPEAVRARQPLFGLTGGAHTSALFDAAGNIPCVQEDVGRHNALDKLIGHALWQGSPMNALGVFLSGRTSLEMVAKAARAHLPLIAAVGAPTALAVEAAERLGITLCGFLRDQRITGYTHTARIEEPSP